jgi:hypothetical protein
MDCRVRPAFRAPLPAANQLRNNETAAEEQDGAIEEDFEALRITQMKARYGDVPAESNGSASEKNEDAGDILRSPLAPSRLIVVRAHQRPPMEK